MPLDKHVAELALQLDARHQAEQAYIVRRLARQLTPRSYGNANEAWHAILRNIIYDGATTSPRNHITREVLALSVTLNANHPVVTDHRRKLNYRFMAAEAAWVLRGANDLASLEKHVKRMRDFSDDGETLAGAYGPRLRLLGSVSCGGDQLRWCAEKLAADRDSRQAVAAIWTPTPAPSKDIPCTVDLQFLVRGYGHTKLQTIVHMRSSDAWLGVPYDLFTFSMVAWRVALIMRNLGVFVKPDTLTLVAGSSHLYAHDFDAARGIIEPPYPVNAEITVPHFAGINEQDEWLANIEQGMWNP